MNPQIIISDGTKSWAALAAEVVERSVHDAISQRGVCNLMLTGGKSAQQLYSYWAKAGDLPLEKINFSFGDERCVSPNHIDSNYAMVMKTLLSDKRGAGCAINRMEAESSDRDAAARAYEDLLPNEIDVLLLSMGVDGHVASLFPHSPALSSKERRVVAVVGPTSSHERLTITPKVIKSAKSVFLMVVGSEKGRLLGEVLKTPSDVMSLPVRLTMNATWLLDVDAGKSFRAAI